MSQNDSINRTTPLFSTNDIHFYVSSDGEIYLEKIIFRKDPNSVSINSTALAKSFSWSMKDLTREDNIFGKTLDFYPLEITAQIGDVTLKETVEIQLIDLNNNAPEATLEYKNVCRTLKPNQGRALTVWASSIKVSVQGLFQYSH